MFGVDICAEEQRACCFGPWFSLFCYMVGKPRASEPVSDAGWILLVLGLLVESWAIAGSTSTFFQWQNSPRDWYEAADLHDTIARRQLRLFGQMARFPVSNSVSRAISKLINESDRHLEGAHPRPVYKWLMVNALSWDWYSKGECMALLLQRPPELSPNRGRRRRATSACAPTRSSRMSLLEWIAF